MAENQGEAPLSAWLTTLCSLGEIMKGERPVARPQGNASCA